jgi:beta-galactosidase
MYYYEGLNYWKLKDALDFVSWDSYPTWHDADDNGKQAARVAMMHDIVRSLKGKPWLLMESTPSLTNWQGVSKNKRPGMHLLSSLQAVAHGSDSVQYFQWRKSRGSSEKFHGAVVDHAGHEHTRVFREVQEVGDALARMGRIAGTNVRAEAAVIFDWENRWAVNDAQGPRNIGLEYERTVRQFYRPLWERGVPVDVIDMDKDFSRYKLLLAPMLYMVRPGVGERIRRFVEEGGTFVATYWSGIVDENDLCFLGGFPGPLRETLGIWSEEIDALHDRDRNGLAMLDGNALGFGGTFEVHELCDLVHLEGAEALAVYESDFYAGRPALTVNRLGRGKAYYVAARTKEPDFLDAFVGKLAEQAGVCRALNAELPASVTAQVRSDDASDYVFVMNFAEGERKVRLDGRAYRDFFTGEPAEAELTLPKYGVRILTRSRV